jgi:hypothetical protein
VKAALTHLNGQSKLNLNTSQADAKSSIQLTGRNRREILEEVLLVVQATERACQQNKWKWKTKKGETIVLRDVFVKMVKWIEKFKGKVPFSYPYRDSAYPFHSSPTRNYFT